MPKSSIIRSRRLNSTPPSYFTCAIISSAVSSYLLSANSRLLCLPSELISYQQYLSQSRKSGFARYFIATARRFWLKMASRAVSPVSAAIHSLSIPRIHFHITHRTSRLTPVTAIISL